jgi:SAM-dependent methyltransferase
MITREELKQFVGSRSWYQTIDFEDDVTAHGPAWCGQPAWENIKKFLPDNLNGKRILDLGCNAGLFCVNSCLMGAKEAIGIDYTEWRPKWDFEEQQVFVKEYFEQKHNRTFPITYISGKMGDVLRDQDLGYFDYTLAIASIYYTFDSERVVERIYDHSEKVIARIRDENRIKNFTTLFKRVGYKETKVFQEKWWEVLGHRNTDDFYLFLYEK